MADKVIPKIEDLQTAFKKMLETNFGNRISPEVYKAQISDVMRNDKIADVLTCHDPKHFDEYLFIGPRIDAKDLTVRQYLSSFAVKLGDHFSYEATRKQAIERHADEYYDFLGNNAKLYRYIWFFNSVTLLADKGMLPGGTELKNIPAILRDALVTIQTKAREANNAAAQKVDEAESPTILEKHTVNILAFNYFIGVRNHAAGVASSAIPPWMPAELAQRIQNESFEQVSSDLIPLVEKNVKLTAKDLRDTYDMKMASAHEFEDSAEIYLKLAEVVRETMKSLDITPRMRSDFGPSR